MTDTTVTIQQTIDEIKENPNSAASILRRALTRLRNLGWLTGSLGALEGRSCALGHIAFASGWDGKGSESRGYKHLKDNGQRDAVFVLSEIVSRCAPSAIPSDNINRVYGFNDRIGQSEEAVERAFNRAIVLAEARGLV